MKQAATDAEELITAYRLEQQDAFDKATNASGKLLLNILRDILHCNTTTHIHIFAHMICSIKK